MLFVALLDAHPATMEERVPRRMEWEYPEGGAQVVAEYWLQTPAPAVIVVFEADHIQQIWALTSQWDDLFEIVVYPAVAAEQGLEILRQP
jgi:hypothetical protein